MAGHITKPYKNTFSGSVGAGMGSLFSPNGRKYYILEHKVTSKYHRAGESQEIIVDNIEIGRDSHCQVRFDESFKTVSRHHAGIVKDGDMWKLVQISKTNSTFLNGRPVKTEWYLQNGDEIQLSVNGPKLGFITPTGKKSTVGSIGLTRRLSLFRQQALRPYKTAITVLSCVLVLAVGGLGTWNFMLKDDLQKQGVLLAEQINANKENKAKADSLANELVANNKKIKGYESKVKQMENEVANAKQAAASARRVAAAASRAAANVGTGGTEELRACANNTYYCEFLLYYKGQLLLGKSGTGFLLNDGRFVTCQHVADMLYGLTGDSNDDYTLNYLLCEKPQDFIVQFVAVSPSGDKIQKEYTVNNAPFRYGSNNLTCIGSVQKDGISMPIRIRRGKPSADWAVLNYGKSGGLAYDGAYSCSMPVKTRLDILGFPKGVGAENINNISPIYSESSVAREGLDTDGCILLSNSETDHGNSGGPVFAQKDGKYVVVGMLSGANPLGSKTRAMSEEEAKETKWKDRVVPIANAK